MILASFLYFALNESSCSKVVGRNHCTRSVLMCRGGGDVDIYERKLND